MDDIARYNLARWRALASADAPFTRIWSDLNDTSARLRVDPDGRLGGLRGRDVLCLASGGGQQAPAFALLGATVTSLDLSPEQVERDCVAARHYGIAIDAQEGDMRDLSRFAPCSFDIVWHAYSLGFVADARQVFSEVRHVLRPGGIYTFMYANPFVVGLGTSDWNGDGYCLHEPYTDGAEVNYSDEAWVASGADAAIPPPKEYRHTLGKVVESLSTLGFLLYGLKESSHATPDAEPGSWEHFTSFAPPWIRFWFVLRPDVLPV